MKTTRRDFLTKTAIAAVGVGLFPAAQSLGAETAATQSSAARQPNILLFFPDQHRYDWLGTTPDLPVRTPNLDALGARGARFKWAVCPSPLCAPSRACLASGMEYDHCRVSGNDVDYPLDQPTFYQALRDAGYHVAGCGKFDLHKASPSWGLDGKHLLPEWGFSDGIDNAGKWDAIRSGAEQPKDPYMAYLHHGGLAQAHVDDFARRKKEGGYKYTPPTPLPEDAYCDNWVAQNGLDLVKRIPSGKPWFLQVNFTGPHEPMDITKRMDAACRGRNFPSPTRSSQFDAATHTAIRQNYSAMVENIDRWLGVYLAELERRGELDNTLVAFSSDHGEMLGDHDLWGKRQPYQASIGVPLVLAGPGVKPGLVVDAPATTLDLHATFLEAAGVFQNAHVDSRSLMPVLEGSTPKNREHVFSGIGEWRVVFDGRYKLVSGYRDGKPLLFDLLNDPAETNDLSEKETAVVSRLSQLLREQAQAQTAG